MRKKREVFIAETETALSILRGERQELSTLPQLPFIVNRLAWLDQYIACLKEHLIKFRGCPPGTTIELIDAPGKVRSAGKRGKDTCN